MTHRSVFRLLLGPTLALLAVIVAATAPVVAHSARIATTGPAVTITEYPLPLANSTPGGLALGSDDAIWFAESDGNRIGRIALNGTITEYPIPTAQSSLSHQAFVGRGADGAIWFTESRANKLGRITTGGQITEYPIPTAPTVPDPTGGTGNLTTSFPIAIAAGPDNAIWFNESFGNKIGRLSNGQITEFPLPNPNTGPVGLIVGPDAALWFTTKTNTIGRITTNGKVTEFPIPTPKSAVLRLAVGPDRAIWFCEAAADKIGRVTTDGKFTEYPLPAGTGPVSIAVGPDGALWFTGFKSNIVGRMTVDGAVATYDVPTAKSAPYHITVGSDRALWFTEIDGNKIGRVALTPQQPQPRPTTAGGTTPGTLPNTGRTDHSLILFLIGSAGLVIGASAIRRRRTQ